MKILALNRIDDLKLYSGLAEQHDDHREMTKVKYIHIQERRLVQLSLNRLIEIVKVILS
jgi:hypothetical protein